VTISHPTLYIAISGHGYGHAGQMAAILTIVRQRLPDWRIVIQSAMPTALLRSLCGDDIVTAPPLPEPTVAMHGPMDVDAERTWQSHRDHHRELDAHIQQHAASMRDAGADAVIANIPYTPLAAAQRLGLPTLAVCSLNWADLLAHYWPVTSSGAAAALIDEMTACYQAAERFITPAPAMPMPRMPNVQPVGPLARCADQGGPALRDRLQTGDEERIVLASMGGIPDAASSPTYPRLPGIRWLVTDAQPPTERDDATSINDAAVPFLDALAGSDAVITKAAYGTIVEAACHGVPVIYVDRPDWPETPGLAQWLDDYGNGIRLDRQSYQAGYLADAVEAALNRAPPKRPNPTGGEDTAAIIQSTLAGA